MADRFQNALEVAELASNPTTPSAGYKKLYPKTDGKLYTKNSAGTETEVGGGLSATTTGTLTLTSGGWSANTQTVTVTGATTTSINLIIIDSITMGDRWGEAKVYATSQGTNSITFTCNTTPASNIDFKVTIIV